MNDEMRKEFHFLLAKYLYSHFPTIANPFISECEKQNLFPSSVFSTSSSFKHLDSSSYSGIPDDQILRLIELACPASEHSSLFFSPANPIKPISLTDILTHKLMKPFNSLANFAPSVRFVGHDKPIYVLVTDLTSQILLTGSDDTAIKIWKIPSMTLMKTLQYHKNVVTEIAIHPTNLYFASSSHDFTICIVSMQDGELLQRIKLSKEVHMVHFSSDGQFLAAACEEGCVKVWKFNDLLNDICEPVTYETSSNMGAAWVNFSMGNNFLVFSADPNIITVVNLQTNERVNLTGHTYLPDFVYFSHHTCKQIFSLSTKEKSIRCWTALNTQWEKHQVYSTKVLNNAKSRLQRATSNCDESKIIAAGISALFVWNPETKELIHRLVDPVYTDHCLSVIAHPSIPDVVFLACANGKCSFWDINKGEIFYKYDLDELRKITEIKWSPDGQMIFVADVCGGVTAFCQFAGNHPFYTMEQYYQYEINGEADDTTIVDSKGISLNPQPKVFKLEDVRFEVKVPTLNPKFIDDEIEMLEMWKNGAIIPPNEPEEDLSESEAFPSLLDSKIFDSESDSFSTQSDDSDDSANESFEATDEEEEERHLSLRRVTREIKPYSPPASPAPQKKNTRSKPRDEKAPPRPKKEKEPIQYDEPEEEEEEEEEESVEEISDDDDFLPDDEKRAAAKTAMQQSRSETEHSNDERPIIRLPSKLKKEMMEKQLLEERRLKEMQENQPEVKVEPEIVPEPKQEIEITPEPEPEQPKEQVQTPMPIPEPIPVPVHIQVQIQPIRKPLPRVEIRMDKHIEAKIKVEKHEEPPIVKEEEPKIKTEEIKEVTVEEKIEKRPTRNRRKVQHFSEPEDTPSEAKDSKDEDKIQPRRSRNGKRKILNFDIQPDEIEEEEESEKKPSKTESKKSTKNSNEETVEEEYIANTDEEEEDEDYAIPEKIPDWCFSTQRVFHTFIPQLGEEIVYFRRGHEENADQCDFENFKPPYEMIPNLPEKAFATIIKSEFFVSHLVLTLKFNKFTSKVLYPLPESLPFIISRQNYEFAIKHASSLKIGSLAQTVYLEDNEAKVYDGKIVGIKPDWKENPYNSFEVVYPGDEEKIMFSPWEFSFIQERNRKTVKIRKLQSSLKAKVNSLFNSSEYESFVMARDDKTQEILLKNSLKPMDLTLLADRLDKDWYQTVDEIVSDIKQIDINAKFIKSQKKVSKDLVKQLLAELFKIAQQVDIDVPKSLKLDEYLEEEI